jgi:hypothetical protein
MIDDVVTPKPESLVFTGCGDLKVSKAQWERLWGKAPEDPSKIATDEFATFIISTSEVQPRD